jgi:SAM-dependent methyltransferase
MEDFENNFEKNELELQAPRPKVSLIESSPHTVSGSFTSDLIASKMWLVQALKVILKNKSAGDIYVLGSWYGNIGVFLQKENVKFNNLVLVETNAEALSISKEILKDLNRKKRLKLLHADACNINYESGNSLTVINCSSNEMHPSWLSRVPSDALTIIQSRNNVPRQYVETRKLADLDNAFSLRKTIYIGEIKLKDPKIQYTRFMKIGYR